MGRTAETSAAQTNTPEATTRSSDSTGRGDVTRAPQLAPNVELSGEMQESGFAKQQWLAQRDGRFIQLTELLYRVAEQADGERTHERDGARGIGGDRAQRQRRQCPAAAAKAASRSG